MTDEARFLIDSLIEQLVLMAVEEYQLAIPEALQLVYNSQLYEKITDLETGLYYQSAPYLDIRPRHRHFVRTSLQPKTAAL